jgi:hypothetical protein
MVKFIKSVLTGANDTISSKRVVLFLLLITFLIVVFLNLFEGKNLSSTLSDQLFYLVIYALASVFGEQITNIWNKKNPPLQP